MKKIITLFCFIASMEKNKQIRLAVAKKTIEELENKN